MIGLAALSAAELEPPADLRVEIADHVGEVLFQLAPLLYHAIAEELARVPGSKTSSSSTGKEGLE